MKVNRKNDREEMPEECDNCGYDTDGELERFYSYGPGHQVNWLCCYCSLDHSNGKDSTVKTIACMLNRLESRIVSITMDNTSAIGFKV